MVRAKRESGKRYIGQRKTHSRRISSLNSETFIISLDQHVKLAKSRYLWGSVLKGSRHYKVPKYGTVS